MDLKPKNTFLPIDTFGKVLVKRENKYFLLWDLFTQFYEF